MKHFVILTLFKDMFNSLLLTKAVKTGIEKSIIDIDILDIRNFTKDKHKRVDFPPYGGGSGMVLSCEPLSAAIDYALNMISIKSSKKIKIIYMSPRGKLLNYTISKNIADDDYNYIQEKFIDYRLSELEKVKDKVKYTLDLPLTKIDDKWELDQISSLDEDKILGIYEY